MASALSINEQRQEIFDVIIKAYEEVTKPSIALSKQSPGKEFCLSSMVKNVDRGAINYNNFLTELSGVQKAQGVIFVTKEELVEKIKGDLGNYSPDLIKTILQKMQTPDYINNLLSKNLKK